MKKHLITLFILNFAFTGILKSQAILGPYDMFVSKQGGNNAASMQGSYPASANEGRVIRVRITDVQGPIIVNPTSYDLTGPPCPTYVNDVRSPATPAPAAVTTFSGRVSLDESNIPAAGTTVAAQFKAKDNGYYTRCFQNQQVPYDSFGTVRFNVVSIRLILADRTAEICNNENATIRVASTYPAGRGTVSWASRSGKIRIVSSNNTQAVIQGLINGNDDLIATFTVGNVSFRDTAKVKVNILKFKKNQFEEPWVKDGVYDATTLLTDSSEKVNLEWSIRAVNGGAATIDAASGRITYPAAAGGNYELSVKIRGAARECKVMARIILFGFAVVLDDRSKCDGEEARLHLVPVPNTLNVAVLRQLGAITLFSKTKVAFGGNPDNKEDLEFDALNATFRSKVKNCYWYAIAGQCNRQSIHNIQAKATVQGKEVLSTNKPELTSNIGNCINGFTSAVQTFTGAPITFTAPVRIMFNGRPVMVSNTAIAGVGTLTRDPRGRVTMFRCPPNSQFFQLLTDEENFHVGQIEGRNGNLCADLWLVANVMRPLTGASWNGVNAAASQAMALQAILLAINNENTRCNNMLTYPPANAKRCAIETEAKAATGVQHGYHMTCAYPLCGRRR